MKERDSLADWNDCVYSNSSIKVTKDIQRAKSLIETSLERIKYINKDLNENTANFIFEDYYTSILELLEAIVLLDGYKVLNHVCLGFYLRDKLNKEDLFMIFDSLRFKRNSLIYYGKRMDLETAIKAIDDSKRLVSELNALSKKYSL